MNTHTLLQQNSGQLTTQLGPISRKTACTCRHSTWLVDRMLSSRKVTVPTHRPVNKNKTKHHQPAICLSLCVCLCALLEILETPRTRDFCGISYSLYPGLRGTSPPLYGPPNSLLRDARTSQNPAKDVKVRFSTGRYRSHSVGVVGIFGLVMMVLLFSLERALNCYNLIPIRNKGYCLV